MSLKRILIITLCNNSFRDMTTHQQKQPPHQSLQVASKLGEDSGLKVYLGDEQISNPLQERAAMLNSCNLEVSVNGSNCTPLSFSTDNTVLHHSDEEMHNYVGSEGASIIKHHHHTGANAHVGGWIARIAALLVGEDPTQHNLMRLYAATATCTMGW